MIRKIRQKYIYIFILIICLSFISVAFIPTTALAASPTATLTVDGVLYDTYASVQEAVDAIETITGDNFIIEIAEGTVSDPLYILQYPEKDIVIQPQPGASVVFTDTITIDEMEILMAQKHCLYKDLLLFYFINFRNCIYFNLIPPRTGHIYPHNVTINGCDFKVSMVKL